jgi:NADH-quinone oxidoreductase subunit D
VGELDFLTPPPPAHRAAAEAKPVGSEPIVLNIGPHHPSTHGVLRVVVQLDGERVISAKPDIGYLHTGIEKTFEAKTYVQGTVLAPRMSYLSPIHNNLAYVLSVERLLGVDVPERATVVRVILAEFDRVASHLVFLGIHALDLGASSVMLYCFRERETILDLMEMVGGARMFPLYIRPGGLAKDLPDGFEDAVGELLDRLPGAIDEYETLLTGNPFWRERTVGVATISADEAIALGVTGPTLRATGVAWDLRKATPYCGYETYDFEAPTAIGGDAFGRYQVRVAEMRQSIRIAGQALRRLPPGPYITDDRKVAPPPKHELCTSMEAVRMARQSLGACICARRPLPTCRLWRRWWLAAPWRTSSPPWRAWIPCSARWTGDSARARLRRNMQCRGRSLAWASFAADTPTR